MLRRDGTGGRRGIGEVGEKPTALNWAQDDSHPDEGLVTSGQNVHSLEYRSERI